MLRFLLLIPVVLSVISTGCYCSRPVLFPRLGCAGCAVPMTPVAPGPIFPRLWGWGDGYAASAVSSGVAGSCSTMGAPIAVSGVPMGGFSAGPVGGYGAPIGSCGPLGSGFDSPIAVSNGYPMSTLPVNNLVSGPIIGTPVGFPSSSSNCIGCTSHNGTIGHNASAPFAQPMIHQPMIGQPMIHQPHIVNPGDSVPLHQPKVIPMGPKVEQSTEPKKQ